MAKAFFQIAIESTMNITYSFRGQGEKGTKRLWGLSVFPKCPLSEEA